MAGRGLETGRVPANFGAVAVSIAGTNRFSQILCGSGLLCVGRSNKLLRTPSLSPHPWIEWTRWSGSVYVWAQSEM